MSKSLEELQAEISRLTLERDRCRKALIDLQTHYLIGAQLNDMIDEVLKPAPKQDEP